MLNPLELSDRGAAHDLSTPALLLVSGGLDHLSGSFDPKTPRPISQRARSPAVGRRHLLYAFSWGWVAVSIAGVPYGIWLGMATALVFNGLDCVIETLAAGMLLRRHGQVSSMIGPYVELIVPANLAVVFACSALFRLATVGLGERAIGIRSWSRCSFSRP